MTTAPQLLINPALRWAIDAGHAGTLAYIDGVAQPAARIPLVGDVLTLPFIVDAITRKPCPVRVIQVLYQQQPGQTVVVPVVVKVQQD